MRTKYYFLELVVGLFLISCSLGNKHDKSSDILSDNTNSFGDVNTAKPEGNGVTIGGGVNTAKPEGNGGNEGKGVTIGGIIKVIKVYPAAIDFKKDTLVSIYGENFDSNLTVTIGGFLCTELNIKSSDEISCLLPKVKDAPIPPTKKVVLQITQLDGDITNFEMDYLLYDSDRDGVPDSVDNCSNYYNPGQETYPGTGIAIACDRDEDSDGDGMGDACDTTEY